jgi:hypothetical protein
MLIKQAIASAKTVRQSNFPVLFQNLFIIFSPSEICLQASDDHTLFVAFSFLMTHQGKVTFPVANPPSAKLAVRVNTEPELKRELL